MRCFDVANCVISAPYAYLLRLHDDRFPILFNVMDMEEHAVQVDRG